MVIIFQDEFKLVGNVKEVVDLEEVNNRGYFGCFVDIYINI